MALLADGLRVPKTLTLIRAYQKDWLWISDYLHKQLTKP
jgi:hypothetical protein